MANQSDKEHWSEEYSEEAQPIIKQQAATGSENNIERNYQTRDSKSPPVINPQRSDPFAGVSPDLKRKFAGIGKESPYITASKIFIEEETSPQLAEMWKLKQDAKYL